MDAWLHRICFGSMFLCKSEFSQFSPLCISTLCFSETQLWCVDIKLISTEHVYAYILVKLSVEQTKTNSCINSVDPDETSRLIRIYTVCLSVLEFRLKTLFSSMDVQIRGRKSLFQKLGVKGISPF